MPGQPARWGWHQLADHHAARIVDRAGIRAGDLVLDIGAGAGALTGPLLATGARVVAVELHRERAAVLRHDCASPRLRVVVADVSDLRLPRRPFRVVANPPFAITTAILRRLVAPGSALVRADVVVPWHTAARWAAGYGPNHRAYTGIASAAIRITSRA